MIKISFHKKIYGENRYFCKIKVSGHSGYSDAGTDIVCAAVSSCVGYMVSTAVDFIGIRAVCKTNPENADLSFEISNPQELFSESGKAFAYNSLTESLYAYLTDLSGEYPDNVRVNLIQ